MMNIPWLELASIPTLLAMVVYINHRLEGHEQKCTVQKQLKMLDEKVDLILNHLLNNNK
jgi:hypothetical protein